LLDITEYKNFWIIWITCAGRPEGTSLFQVQNEWNIKTNYLYHTEAGLGKPLFRYMVNEGYLAKDGKNLIAKFGWIPGYIRKKYKTPEAYGLVGFWSPNTVINEKWFAVQQFIEENRRIIFSPEMIKVLYQNDKETAGRNGCMIFRDVFLYVLFSNMMTFCRKYNAEIVMRIISTLMAICCERDVLNYMHKLDAQMRAMTPVIIKDEDELAQVLCTLKW
jgi:hypothetical protein